MQLIGEGCFHQLRGHGAAVAKRGFTRGEICQPKHQRFTEEALHRVDAINDLHQYSRPTIHIALGQ